MRHVWAIFGVNVGKYSIHGASGIVDSSNSQNIWKICFDQIIRKCEPSNQYVFFPPARWGLLDFNRALLLLLLRLLTRLAVQIPVGTAGPPPRAPDPSGHCRTSTASCRSQWALPDLNRDFQVAVGTAGPQPRAPDPSGHCRTSTASSRSQWALPDLNGQIECQKICQMECQIECQKICQIECQKICQIECQKICQIECQKICQIECQKICQIECQEICQKICQNICQKICQIECQKICQ